jgi:hypothetical protein
MQIESESVKLIIQFSIVLILLFRLLLFTILMSSMEANFCLDYFKAAFRTLKKFGILRSASSS